MPKFRVIHGSPAPDNPAERARKRTRQSARDWPACRACGGREVIVAKIGNVSNKLCVCCLMVGRRVVVE
jgi:hypothetical protein